MIFIVDFCDETVDGNNARPAFGTLHFEHFAVVPFSYAILGFDRPDKNANASRRVYMRCAVLHYVIE